MESLCDMGRDTLVLGAIVQSWTPFIWKSAETVFATVGVLATAICTMMNDDVALERITLERLHSSLEFLACTPSRYFGFKLINF